MHEWHKKFMETGCVLQQTRYGSASTTAEVVEQPLIRPVVSYGAEARTLTKKEEQPVLIFERKIFRRIYGLEYENGNGKVGRIEN